MCTHDIVWLKDCSVCVCCVELNCCKTFFHESLRLFGMSDLCCNSASLSEFLGLGFCKSLVQNVS